MNMKKAFLIVACFLAVGGVSSYAQDVGVEPTVILADDVYAKSFIAEQTQIYVLAAPTALPELSYVSVADYAPAESVAVKSPDVVFLVNRKQPVKLASGYSWRIRMRTEEPLISQINTKSKKENPDRVNYFRSLLR